VISRKAGSEDELLEALTDAAATAAADLKAALRKESQVSAPPMVQGDTAEVRPQPAARSETRREEAPVQQFPVVPRRDNALSINPLSLLFGNLGAEFEHALAPKVTLYVAPAFVYPWILGVNAVPELDLSAGGRIYLGAGAFDGLYVGGGVLAGAVLASVATFPFFGLSANAGYAFRVGDSVLIAVGGNLGFIGSGLGFFPSYGLRLSAGFLF
jgi:hypothetical protein